MFLKLDKSKLPNLANMDPAIMKFAETYDPGNQHAIVYLLGTSGIGYNPDMVEKALGTRTIDSLAAVFDPAVAAKLAGCGITMLDFGGDVLSAAKLYLGLELNSEDPADLSAAKQVLMRVRATSGTSIHPGTSAIWQLARPALPSAGSARHTLASPDRSGWRSSASRAGAP